MSMTARGHTVRTLREVLGLTQLELALRAGVAERTVRNAEKSRAIRRPHLEFIAGALGVSLLEIVDAEPEFVERWAMLQPPAIAAAR